MNKRHGYEGPGLYKNWKGQFYTVLFLSKNSETGEECVVYIPAYVTKSGMQPTHRPRAMFDEIKYAPPADQGGPWVAHDGSRVYSLPRFQRVRNEYGEAL